MERAQPIVIGINEKGEMIWSNIEMPMWQRRMFPIRYTGDFFTFWEKLNRMQKADQLLDDVPNFAGFKANVPGSEGVKLMAKHKRKHHKGD